MKDTSLSTFVISKSFYKDCLVNLTNAYLPPLLDQHIQVTSKGIFMVFKLDLTQFSSLEELLDRFKTIPDGTTELDLSWNSLDQLSEDQLRQIFAAIPKTITALNLGWNGLGASLAGALEAIEAPLTSLILAGNDFYTLRVTELQQIIKAAPATVRLLDLSHNFLAEEKSGDEIAQIVRVISPGVSSFNFYENHLYLKGVRELAKILRAIPKTVLSIGLEDIFRNKTKRERKTLLAVLREVDPEGNRLCDRNNSGKNCNLSMQIVGGFITVLGITAVALALTVLSGGTLGLVLGIAGIAGILAGVGLFAVGKYRNCQEEQASPHEERFLRA